MGDRGAFIKIQISREVVTKSEKRRAFREGVLRRDENICCVCGNRKRAEDLDAHHITDRHEMPNGGYTILNCITVCKGDCHRKVEVFHISGGKRWEQWLHPDDLYKMIGSSYEQAFLDS